MRLHPIYLLRITGLLDGLSLLALLGIAMPMKYRWGIDEAVTIAGSIHGGIFIAYALAIVYAAVRIQWNVLWSAASLLAAFVPFGNFLLDRKLKKAQSQYGVKPLNIAMLVYSIVFFSFFDLFSQLPVMSTFAASVGASSFIVGFVIGLYSLANTVGNIVSGVLTDKAGPFKLLLTGLLLSSAALLLYQFADRPLFLIAVRIVHGFVAGLIVPAAFTFSANSALNGEQGKKVAFTGTFVGLAAIVGPAFSGITASKTSVPFVFQCVALIGLLLAALTAVFLRRYRIAAAKKETVQLRPTGSMFNRGVILSYGGAFFLMFSQGAIAYLLPLHVQALGYDSRLSGTLMSTFGIIAVLIFALPTNRIFDRIAPAPTMAAGIGLMGTSQLLLSLSSSTLTLYLVLALYGIGFALLFPSINTMLIHSVPAEWRGKAYGYFYAFFSLGVVAGSSVLGWLPFDIRGGFVLTGIVLLICSVCAVLGRQGDRAFSRSYGQS